MTSNEQLLFPCCTNMTQFVGVLAQNVMFWFMCPTQVSGTEPSNYIPQILGDVITCPCPWYLLLPHKHMSWFVRCVFVIQTPFNRATQYPVRPGTWHRALLLPTVPWWTPLWAGIRRLLSIMEKQMALVSLSEVHPVLHMMRTQTNVHWTRHI